MATTKIVINSTSKVDLEKNYFCFITKKLLFNFLMVIPNMVEVAFMPLRGFSVTVKQPPHLNKAHSTPT